jgi:polysaccharide biosynthesis transport protein
MTFEQFLGIVKARWKLSAAIFLSIVIVTIVATRLWPKSYSASASVMLDTRPDPVSALGGLAGGTGTNHLATQVDIIGSQRVAQAVVFRTGLDKSEEMKGRWKAETQGRGDYLTWAANLLGKSLEIKPSRESNVIEIGYESADPKFAASMANAFAQAYIESAAQIRQGPARRYSEFFEERARAARVKLEKAQAALAEAQRSKDILATDERLDVETVRLNDLSSQLLALRAMRVESGNRSKQAKRQPDQVSDVLNNSNVSSLKSTLALQEAQFNQLSERFGDQHPTVIEAKAQIQSLRSKLALEISRVTNSVESLDTVNRSRESAALTAYEEQRAKVMQLKEERSKLALLEREVESANRIYETIELRASQTNLESNNSQSAVVLLSEASEPANHTSPRMMLNLGLASTLGLLLSLIAVLAAEMLDRRVRTAFDIVDTVELPVLGVLPGLRANSSPRISWFGKPRSDSTFTSLTPTLK